MADFHIRGAIFDVDDTLLDNNPGVPGQGLHERSRLAAVHEVGNKHNIPELAELSAVDNLQAFLDAPVHTLESAVWNILRMTGIADSDVINPKHPLLLEIVIRKNQLHETILLREGKEVPGAVAFLRHLESIGLRNKMAIASTAVRRDIDLFVGKMRIADLFPDVRIVSKESVTHPKPNPEVYDLAFRSLHLPEAARSQVCAFEDDPRGIMAAIAAGLYTCAITTRFSRPELLALEVAPDLIADSYAEFTELLSVGNKTIQRNVSRGNAGINVTAA